MAKKKVIHYAKKGFHMHWWGAGWHTGCGRQIPEDEQYHHLDKGMDLPNTTKELDKTTCNLCRNTMDFYCKKCHNRECKCE